MSQVKALYTIGLANRQYDILSKILGLGNSGVLLSLKSDEFKNEIQTIEDVREYNHRNNSESAIFVNILGYEIRVQKLITGEALLCENDEVVISTETLDEGVPQKISVNYERLHEDVQVGSYIYINCGRVQLQVLRIEEKEIVCKVLKGGIIYDYSTVNAAETNIKFEFLTSKDREELIFCCEQNVDYVAISFVRNKEDVLSVREILDNNKGKNIKIISKIENREGVNNLEEILSVSDGIMVARGDLGVEVPFVELPAIQKKVLRLCNERNKLSIVATHILASMREHIVPYRSEIDSIFHMVQDGVGCIMLSGESAKGKHPDESAKVLREAIDFAEKYKNQNIN